MGYALNVIMSIPMSIILYILTEKIIINITSDNNFNDRVQKSFIMSFVVGLVFIALGMTVFNENSNIDNQSIRYALYSSGCFLIVNSVFFSWDNLDEETKIIILGISISCLVLYSYNNIKNI